MFPGTEDVNDLWADEVYEGGFKNIDPERQRLYELCEDMGVGITVMKAFARGDILDEKLSPAGAALTPAQCISYALSRPAVAAICSGARNEKQLAESIAYCEASDEEKSYAEAFAAFPRVSWSGHCMYCTHCHPCPAEISIADVTKFLNLVVAHQCVREPCRLLGDFFVGSHHFLKFFPKEFGVHILFFLIAFEFLVQPVNLLFERSEQLADARFAFLVHCLAAVVKEFGCHKLESVARFFLKSLAGACHGVELGLQLGFVAVERVFEVIELLDFLFHPGN
jgi:hypothetical protein